MSPAPQAMSLRAHELPFRQRPGLLHLESCGDLSTFTAGEGQSGQSAERRIQRAEHERPHSLIGVVRETVLWGGFSLFLRRVFLSGIHAARENHLWQAGGRGCRQPIFYTPTLRLPMGSSFCSSSLWGRLRADLQMGLFRCNLCLWNSIFCCTSVGCCHLGQSCFFPQLRCGRKALCLGSLGWGKDSYHVCALYVSARNTGQSQCPCLSGVNYHSSTDFF